MRQWWNFKTHLESDPQRLDYYKFTIIRLRLLIADNRKTVFKQKFVEQSIVFSVNEALAHPVMMLI